MSNRSEINRQDLLNCDEGEDENEKLKEFYERNLPFLKEYPSQPVLAKIARMIHKTLLNSKVEWMEYAATLGITDVDILDQIEERAECCGEQQLFIVFTRVLTRTKRFDHLIRMLLEHKRFDVLLKIYPDAEGLIAESCKTRVKGHLMIEPEYGSEQLTSTACSVHELDSEASSDCSNCSKFNMNTFMQNPPSYIRKEFNNFQQSSVNDSCRTEINIHDSTVFHENLEKNIPLEREIAPSAPPVQENPEEKKISVFIQHTKPDADYASQLSSKFKNAGFKVKTMSDMDVILAINETEALSAIYKEVDFVVPVISESLLKQIHATHKQQFDSDDADNNNYFYKLIVQEYKKNNCLNYKVRPVIVPGMMKQKLKKDIVLSFPFRFGIEDDKLIRVLKETKELIPQYRLQI